MTVQEFYDDLAQRQAQQPGKKKSALISFLLSIVAAPLAKPAPASDEHLNEIDDPTHRQSVRLMEEYKDENPRGSGNRYNRS